MMISADKGKNADKTMANCHLESSRSIAIKAEFWNPIVGFTKAYFPFSHKRNGEK
jgi:hypothetical protein